MTIGSLLAVGGHTATAATPHTLAVSTDELNFGQQTLGVGGTLTFTLSNNGGSSDSINLASATYTGPGAANYIVVGSSGCPGGPGPRIVLASGQSCPIDVSFFPSALRQFPAAVTMQGSADTSGVSVNLTGEGSIGYYQVDTQGAVATAGDAANFGGMRGKSLNGPIVAITPTGDNAGYWLVGSDGGVYSFGDARFWGSAGNLALNKPIVGMAATGGSDGYWLVASDGGVFSYGDAQFWGSAGSMHLNAPIVGMVGGYGGYWLVASDGGVFAYGDAAFHGSAGGMHLNAPIVGMAPTPDAGGYWLVASDGGVFAYGDARFYGSTGALHLAAPVVGIAAMPTGGGYWISAADGGLFAYGDGPFYGSSVGSGIGDVVGVAEDGGASAVLL